MPIRLRHIAKETGAALAVLALYMLVLLAPLHQAAGMQRDLALLGYESNLSWSVCTSVADKTGGDETPTAAKCPLTVVGKLQLAVLPHSPDLPLPALDAEPVRHDIASALRPHGPSGRPGQPRAPPARA